jgi:hypothetical protein
MTKPLDGGPVGYRGPPQHSRFRPGQSGNPTGRPKHAPNFPAAFLAELSEMIDVAGGAPMSKQDALIRCLVDQAIAGNLRATAALLPVLMQAIAVGTLITERPPHRSERARFGHSAPTAGV